MILYIENPEDSTQKLLELINSAQQQDTRLTQRNWLCFFILTVKYQKSKKKKKKIPFKITLLKKNLRNKPDQEGERLTCNYKTLIKETEDGLKEKTPILFDWKNQYV